MGSRAKGVGDVDENGERAQERKADPFFYADDRT